jgi:coenzyme F420-0:L-glutamate ligase/coenzyme F420-1:gamma-L-glutamate ligase
MDQLHLTALPGIGLIQPGDDLTAIILEGLARVDLTLQDRDVLVIAQKIVSKAEGRLVHWRDITPSSQARELAALTGKHPGHVQAILDESLSIVRAAHGVLITEQRAGWICANAGVDHSNVDPTSDDCLALLPEDADRSAQRLRHQLKEATGAEIAVIINDTHGRAWRMGAVGVAIGVAGLRPITDLRGQVDLFGMTLRSSEVGTADEIASAASLLMGQSNEGRPIVHLRGVPFLAGEGRATEIVRPAQLDLFR